MLLRTALAVAATSSIAFAQNDYNYDKTSSGRLGSPLTLSVTNAPPNQFLFFIVSFNAGPIPLVLLDGIDTRSLQVGGDLLDLLSLGVTSAGGTASYTLNTVNDITWNNLVLHWQTAVWPGSPTFFGQISNDIVTQTGFPDTGLLAPATLGSARAFGTAFFDRNNNAGAGDVLVAGGGAGTITGSTGLATSERWDFRHMTVSPGPTMSTARSLHVAVTLTDNRVLIIGGSDSTGAILSSCEIYDPTTNLFTPAAPMSTPRMLHAACRLADGRVMVAGGASALDVVNLSVSALRSVEIYNPVTNTWAGGPDIGGYRIAPALTLLSTNQVMVSGGVQVNYLIYPTLPLSASTTTAVQRWNPASPASWGAGAAMPTDRALHHYNQVTLNDGRVLMTGGMDVASITTITTAPSIANADVYNPTTNTWASFPMTAARSFHSATKLADGRVVVCGGAQGTLSAPVSIDGVEVFNPATNAWAAAPVLTGPRAGHAAALTPDNLLLLLGGQGATATLNTIETLRF